MGDRRLLMFEDLIPRQGCRELMKQKVQNALADEACPHCNSLEIEPTYGTFIPGGFYIQTMICTICSTRWTITYDGDLNIVKVQLD